MRKKRLGKRGENLALSYLEKIGYHFVDRNFNTRMGEIDLIFKYKQKLVFIEVKTRKLESAENMESAINKKKIRHIKSSAHIFKKLHPELPDSFRLDVIFVLEYPNGDLKVSRHYKNISP